MARRKRLTPNQKEYYRITSELEKFINAMEKRGYVFSPDVIPEKPKRITKRFLNRLSTINNYDILANSKFVDFDTGEIINESGLQAYKQGMTQDKIHRQQYAFFFPGLSTSNTSEYTFTDNILNNFYSRLSNFRPEFQGKVKNWILQLLSEYGKDKVANMLQEGAYKGVIIDYTVAYSEQQFENYITDMMNFLPPPTNNPNFKDEIFDIINKYDDFEGDYND